MIHKTYHQPDAESSTVPVVDVVGGVHDPGPVGGLDVPAAPRQRRQPRLGRHHVPQLAGGRRALQLGRGDGGGSGGRRMGGGGGVGGGDVLVGPLLVEHGALAVAGRGTGRKTNRFILA